MKTLTIEGAISAILRTSVAMLVEQATAMEAAAVLVEKRAKAIIGHYQTDTGPFDAWKPLADSTVVEKERLGYAPPDNPLLRTGDLRASIGHSAELRLAYVGSDEDIAVWQELGTATIPPRSFLGAAAFQRQDEVAELIGTAIVAALAGDASFRKVIR